MKAFWFFSKNNGSNGLSLPAGLSSAFGAVVPCDIYRLQKTLDHVHLLLGGFAIADDTLVGQAGEGHTHLLVKIDDTWHHVTRGASEHDHPLSVDGLNNILPDYFLAFCFCNNPDALLINNHADCFPIVEAVITQGEENSFTIGELDNTAWSSVDLQIWQTRCQNLLGFDLPDQVDRGKRLVQLFVGALSNRSNQQEEYFRFTNL